MAKRYFFPDDALEQVSWLNTFLERIGTYAAKYGITPAEVTAIEEDIEWYKYWFEGHLLIKSFGQNITAFKNEVAYGVPEGSPVSVTPVFPVAPVAPTAVAPGVFTRILYFANRIKTHSAYTVADGEALGLEGVEQTPHDLNTLRPVLTLSKTGTGVTVKWKKNRTNGVEIWVKRGTADWVFLAMDSTPDYVDTHEFPAALEQWQYKAIYHLGDARAGNWSEVVSIAVQA